jgi:hypothetical protein
MQFIAFINLVSNRRPVKYSFRIMKRANHRLGFTLRCCDANRYNKSVGSLKVVCDRQRPHGSPAVAGA